MESSGEVNSFDNRFCTFACYIEIIRYFIAFMPVDDLIYLSKNTLCSALLLNKISLLRY